MKTKWIRFLPLVVGILVIGLAWSVNSSPRDPALKNPANRNADKSSSRLKEKYLSPKSRSKKRSGIRCCDKKHRHQSTDSESSKGKRGRAVHRALHVYRTGLFAKRNTSQLSSLREILFDRTASVYEWKMALWAIAKRNDTLSLDVLREYLSSKNSMERKKMVIPYLFVVSSRDAIPIWEELACRGPADELATTSVNCLRAHSKQNTMAKAAYERVQLSSLWQ